LYFIGEPHFSMLCSHIKKRKSSLNNLFYFYGTGSWTQGSELARQVFYHLSQPPPPVLSALIFLG
jgi:hypothetical protein